MHNPAALVAYITFGFVTYYHHHRRKGNSNRPVTSVSLVPRSPKPDQNGFRIHNDQVAVAIRHT